MSLGCGLFGPPLPTKHLEKRYPSNRSRTQYEIGMIVQKDKQEILFGMWLISGKFYGADYMNETND